ncbi:hypothetical protein IFM89_023610 [Coptis chinensis]|uniref:Uncharacterized protein n=1 Tax=Coptis chinensis TaxID=261450 RepID=A0A835HM27_9MAGN|nr:hypothetical protein IFM89_023610 [Coptis chinensis]
MSSTTRAWVAAASVGIVVMLKDQGVCRWNSPLRLLQQHAKISGRSIYESKRFSCTFSSVMMKKLSDENTKQSEESLGKVMFLSCWGAN